MTQQSALEVGLPAVGIDQGAVLVFGDCIDGQIAASEVVFEAHPAIDLECEPGVAMPALAFASRQRVLVAGARIEKHREVAPDTAETARQHLALGGADDYPVTLEWLDSEQTIAHRAADQVRLHGEEFCSLF